MPNSDCVFQHKSTKSVNDIDYLVHPTLDNPRKTGCICCRDAEAIVNRLATAQLHCARTTHLRIAKTTKNGWSYKE